MNVCVLERKRARARPAEIWFCGCAVLCQALSSGGRRSGSVSVLALLVLLAFLAGAGLLLPFNIIRCSSDQPPRSSAQTSPRSKARLITSAKGRSSETRNRSLCIFTASERPTNDFFSEVTTICACDLAPKHSQAALQLLLIYNLWKIKALQCGRSRQPRSLHPSSLKFWS